MVMPADKPTELSFVFTAASLLIDDKASLAVGVKFSAIFLLKWY